MHVKKYGQFCLKYNILYICINYNIACKFGSLIYTFRIPCLAGTIVVNYFPGLDSPMVFYSSQK